MNTLPSSLRIGVLRGGPSSEYDVSLKGGANVLEKLNETHRPIDIFISKDGTWHMHGVPRSPQRILKHLDVVFNALHGAYGEDGTVQELLDHHGVPYTGSGRYASAIALNKYLTKEHVMEAGIKTPIHGIVRSGEDISSRIRDIFSVLSPPIVVKPLTGGFSLGVVIARTPERLRSAIEERLAVDDGVLVEEYISGREASCGVINNFRGKAVYALPPVEIILPENHFFDYDKKYTDTTRVVCPSYFSDAEKKEIEDISSRVHALFGLKHYSRSDFIVHPKRGIYFLEVNTLPGLTPESLMPKSLEAIGVSTKDFIHHLISLALQKK